MNGKLSFGARARPIVIAVAVLVAADAVAVWRLGVGVDPDAPPAAAAPSPRASEPRVLPTLIEREPADAKRNIEGRRVPRADEPVPELVCRNSTDPACGSLRWLPSPGRNRPLTLDVLYEPGAPTVGQVVRFVVTARDPDARAKCCDVFVDGGRGGISHAVLCAPDERYGPWTPPAPRGGTDRYVFEWTFDEPGNHRVTFKAQSGPECGAHPYRSRARLTVEFVVWPAEDAEA